MKENQKLKTGEIIITGDDKWQIIDVNDKIATIKVLSVSKPYLERYLDVGKEYKLNKHSHWDDLSKGDELFELWEIEPASMKRQVSQVILMVDGALRIIDLDF